jgi:hypothetical protein
LPDSSGLYRKRQAKKNPDSPMKRDKSGFFLKLSKRMLVPTAGFELAT